LAQVRLLSDMSHLAESVPQVKEEKQQVLKQIDTPHLPLEWAHTPKRRGLPVLLVPVLTH
jgi:hypothetical protein